MLGKIIKRSHLRIEIMNFEKGKFSADFFGWLITFFESNPEADEDNIARFRTEIIEEINPMYEAAEELYGKYKTANLAPVKTSSGEPIAKKSKTEPGASDDASSESSSSPRTWSFSSTSDEEDDTVDIVTFVKNQQKKYDKIVSQVNNDAQIFMSISLVRLARTRLSNNSRDPKWSNSRFGLPDKKRKKN